MARFAKCEFGKNNVLYDDVVLTDVMMSDFTYVSYRSRLNGVRIGKFSCVGPEVLAGLGMHPSRDFVAIHPFFYSPKYISGLDANGSSYFKESKQITIGNDVWIGARAVILDGVDIGNGAIVGAGAVVVKSVPAYAVVGGVPAKVLRYRFSAEQIKQLEQVKWWDKDIGWLRRNASEFRNIQSFLSVN